MPQSFYALDRDRLGDFRRFVADLARRLDPNVFAYECWNEPNLWPYIYPQRTADDEYFAARLYLAMLKAFRNGLQDAGSTAKVVAGATAPIGLDDKYRTSPQRFARFLQSQGAADFFDAYSHHPYVPGGSVNKAPDQPPNDPTTTVTLYNLKQLLSLFPGKPFYLTEYGYNTKPCVGFGGFTATPVQQATYLQKAYRYAGRYSQVKMLVWYMVKDFQFGPDPMQGVYSGLRNVDGTRKLSWFAFAGGNRLTIEAPGKARAGTSVKVRGALTNAAIGAVKSRTLELQSRKVSGGAWRTIKTTRTGSDGRYRFYVKASKSCCFRVLWRGVRASATRTVWVY